MSGTRRVGSSDRWFIRSSYTNTVPKATECTVELKILVIIVGMNYGYCVLEVL